MRRIVRTWDDSSLSRLLISSKDAAGPCAGLIAEGAAAAAVAGAAGAAGPGGGTLLLLLLLLGRALRGRRADDDRDSSPSPCLQPPPTPGIAPGTPPTIGGGACSVVYA